MRAFLIAVLMFLPGLAFAACSGTDLRPTLSAAEAAELARAEANTPYPNGNLWRAKRDGQVIHVIGTMHIDDPRMDPLAERLAPLVQNADTMYVEITSDEEARMEELLMQDPSLLMLTDTTLPDVLDEETWALVAEAAKARGLPAFMAAKMQPWYLSVMLSMPSCMIREIAENDASGLDKRLMKQAETQGVKLQGLEKIEDVIGIFIEEDFETQVHFLVAGLMPDDVSADMIATTAEAYFDEANAQNWELSKQLVFRHVNLPREELSQAFDDFEKSLLTNRNRAWMETIREASADQIVIAVGALHLMGENGLLNLLEQEGYDLTRLPF